MRISDWSSDVCSSDLVERPDVATALRKIVEPRSPVEPQRVGDAARQRRTMQQQHRGAAVAIGGVCAQQMKRMRRVLAVDRMAFRFGGGVHGSSFRVEGIKSAGDEVAYRFRITAFVLWHNEKNGRASCRDRVG